MEKNESLKDRETSDKVLLDFKNSIFIKTNLDYRIVGSFVHDVDINTVPNIYVPIIQFLSLCERFEELNITYNIDNKNIVFKDNSLNENFECKIPIIVEEDDISVEFNDDNVIDLTIDDEIVNRFKNAYHFIGNNQDSRNFKGIKISNNKVVSLNGTGLYFGNISNSTTKDINADFSISVISMINIFPYESFHLSFNNDNELLMKDKNEEIKIIFDNYQKLDIPDSIFDKDFEKKYKHKYNLTVEKSSFLDRLNFIYDFVKYNSNEVMTIEVINTDEILLISLGNTELKESYNLCQSIDESQVGKSFQFSRKTMYDAISIISDNEIEIQINLENDEMAAFNVTGKSNKEQDIAISRLID